jgi:hypothetical protein
VPTTSHGHHPPVVLPAIISVLRAALLLDIAIRSTYRMVEAGVIPVTRTSRRILTITAKAYAVLGPNAKTHPFLETRSDDYRARRATVQTACSGRSRAGLVTAEVVPDFRAEVPQHSTRRSSTGSARRRR